MKDKNDEPHNISGDNKNNSKIIMNSKLDLYKIPLNTILHGNLLNFEGEYFKKLYEEAEKEEKKEYHNDEIKEEIILPNINENIDNTNDNNDNNKEQIKKEELLKEKNEDKKIEVKKETKNKIKNKEIKKKSKSDNMLKEIKHNNILNYNKNNQIQKNPIFKINKIAFEIKYDTQLGENISVIGSIGKLGCWDSCSSLNLNWNEGNIWTGSFDYNEDKDFEYKYILVNNGYIKEWENGINRKFIFQQIKSLIEPNLVNGNIILLKNIMYQTLEYDYNTYSLKIVSEWNKK